MLTGLDHPRLIAALVLLVSALFIASGTVARQHRPLLRRLAIVVYGAAVGLALYWVWRWLGR